jgi:hypothetical protein
MNKDSSKFLKCHLCGTMTHEYNVIMSPYGDPYCKRCDEFKKKYPMKTRDQLLSIMPPAKGEGVGVNIALNVIVVLAIAFLIYLFL